MALLQQHDARRDILIEPAARWRAAIEARGHSELGAFRTGGRSRAVKTNLLVVIIVVHSPSAQSVGFEEYTEKRWCTGFYVV